MGKALNIMQAAEKLQVQPNTVRNWIKQGKIPGRKIGRVFRISEESLDRFIEAQEQPDIPKPGVSAFELLGRYPGSGHDVDEFMAEKHRETEEEERRLEERGKPHESSEDAVT
jgi:excisionase family DNA binding protein